MDTSFRLQIIKENDRFVVPLSEDIELDESTLSQVRSDLEGWISQYETQVGTEPKFYVKSGDREVILQ